MTTKSSSQCISKAKQISKGYYSSEYGSHYSCGISIALTFGVDPKPYRSLRRGGILGYSECGALKAGEMILGEFLGDPNPAGPVTESLREAVSKYRKRIAEAGYEPYGTCSHLTGQFPDFNTPERRRYCTELVAFVSGTVAELLKTQGIEFQVHDPTR